MWFTTRQEGLDDPRPAMRGPCVDLPTTVFCGGVGGNSFLLRGGFLLQLFSLTGLFISYWASGGSGLFGYELQGMNEVRLSLVACTHVRSPKQQNIDANLFQ